MEVRGDNLKNNKSTNFIITIRSIGSLIRKVVWVPYTQILRLNGDKPACEPQKGGLNVFYEWYFMKIYM